MSEDRHSVSITIVRWEPGKSDNDFLSLIGRLSIAHKRMSEQQALAAQVQLCPNTRRGMLTVTVDRPETDEEYQTRLDITSRLAQIEETRIRSARAAKKDRELRLLRQLTKKYGRPSDAELSALSETSS